MNSNFEHGPFEKDFQVFTKEIKEHQTKNQIENLQESHVKDFLKLKTFSVQPSAVPNQRQAIEEVEALPDYMKEESSDVRGKVENLLSLAFYGGLEKATKEAIKSGPFILDAFHDALTSKLYSELKNRGLLK